LQTFRNLQGKKHKGEKFYFNYACGVVVSITVISASSAVVQEIEQFTKSVELSVLLTSVISHDLPSKVIVEPALASVEAVYCMTPLILTVLRLLNPTISII
jgi:hypothetical protein